jgi:hypothetical protein
MNIINMEIEQNVNLVTKIEENEIYLNAKTLISNIDKDEFTKYLVNLDKYFTEMKSKKYNQKYKYFVNNEGNFEKKAIEEKNKDDNYVIEKPKYINIEERLAYLKIIIAEKESKLRFLRSSILDGNKKADKDFDSVKEELILLIKEKELLNHISSILDKSDTIQDNFEKRIQQNDIYSTIKELISSNTLLEQRKIIIKRYIENNNFILKTQKENRLLKEESKLNHVVDILPSLKKSTQDKQSKKKKTIFKKKANGKLDIDFKKTVSENKNDTQIFNFIDDDESEIIPNINFQELPKSKNIEIQEEDDEKNDIPNKNREMEINLDTVNNELPNIEIKEQNGGTDLNAEVLNLDFDNDLEMLAPNENEYYLDEVHDEDEDEDEDGNYFFNKTQDKKNKVMQEINTDRSLPLNFCSESNSEDTDIDIDKLSRDLNKKINKDQIINIKITEEALSLIPKNKKQK